MTSSTEDLFHSSGAFLRRRKAKCVISGFRSSNRFLLQHNFGYEGMEWSICGLYPNVGNIISIILG
jgi:hypothetical protein